MMRIASISYDDRRVCRGCAIRDERQVSTYILAFQIADHFLRRYQGKWTINGNEITLQLHELTHPISIEVISGTINYGTLTTSFYHRYLPYKGITALIDELCSDLAIPMSEPSGSSEFMFKVFVKLVEIFHARCDLHIAQGKTAGEWEIHLNKDGPVGWVGEDGIAENRFGQKIDILQWRKLRAEKAAMYIFEFNRFCQDFECPLK